MKLLKGYKQHINDGRDIVADAQEVAVLGGMNADGDIFPDNGPHLIATKVVEVSQMTGDPILLADLQDMVGFDIDLDECRVTVYPTVDLSSDAAQGDGYHMGVSDANNTVRYFYNDVNVSYTPGATHTSNFNPSGTYRYLTADFIAWAAAETHTGRFRIEVRKYPAAISM
jgi:hypothetical protein